MANSAINPLIYFQMNAKWVFYIAIAFPVGEFLARLLCFCWGQSIQGVPKRVHTRNEGYDTFSLNKVNQDLKKTFSRTKTFLRISLTWNESNNVHNNSFDWAGFIERALSLQSKMLFVILIGTPYTHLLSKMEASRKFTLLKRYKLSKTWLFFFF